MMMNSCILMFLPMMLLISTDSTTASPVFGQPERADRRQQKYPSTVRRTAGYRLPHRSAGSWSPGMMALEGDIAPLSVDRPSHPRYPASAEAPFSPISDDPFVEPQAVSEDNDYTDIFKSYQSPVHPSMPLPRSRSETKQPTKNSPRSSEKSKLQTVPEKAVIRLAVPEKQTAVMPELKETQFVDALAIPLANYGEFEEELPHPVPEVADPESQLKEEYLKMLNEQLNHRSFLQREEEMAAYRVHRWLHSSN